MSGGYVFRSHNGEGLKKFVRQPMPVSKERREMLARLEARDREYARLFGDPRVHVVIRGGITHRQTVNELVGRFR